MRPSLDDKSACRVAEGTGRPGVGSGHAVNTRSARYGIASIWDDYLVYPDTTNWTIDDWAEASIVCGVPCVVHARPESVFTFDRYAQ
jgi:hypothetical protein